MGRIKGAAIRARLEYVREVFGEDALGRVIDSLDDMDQVILTGKVLPSIWYPFQVLASFDEAVRRILGGGGHEVFEQAGEHVARQHAKSIYRVFFRETEPARVLRLASCIVANYYSGLGKLSVRTGGDGESEKLQVGGASVSARPYCVTLLAYFRTVLESCTGLEIHARETRCSCWGDEVCEFDFAWEPALERAASA